jgi:hypothetical protein
MDVAAATTSRAQMTPGERIAPPLVWCARASKPRVLLKA